MNIGGDLVAVFAMCPGQGITNHERPQMPNMHWLRNIWPPKVDHDILAVRNGIGMRCEGDQSRVIETEIDIPIFCDNITKAR
jgi:hypothetical protein